jgi:phosphoserine phosphatase RsbU/P
MPEKVPPAPSVPPASPSSRTFHSFLTGDRARDQRNVDLLLGAVEELYGSADHETLLRRAVDRAILVTGAQRGVLLLAGSDGVLRVRVARDVHGKELGLSLRYSRSVADQVWKTGAPHVTIDTQGTRTIAGSITDLRLLSVLAVPLASKDRSIGVLYVDSTAAVKEFTEGDRAVFEALAVLVSVAHEQARLTTKAAEVDVARKIQESMLPRALKPPAGFELAALARPCVDTSGDYYDVIPLADGTLALVVGDVAGHGLGAALFMTSARALLRTLLRASKEPVAAFEAMNAYLVRDMPDESFMSLFVGLLDPKTSTLRWVSAGHNAPLLLRAAGGIEELPRTGPVLGVYAEATYGLADPVRLAPGDSLLLYTDGLFEAWGDDGVLWGEDRMRAAFEAHAATSSSAAAVLEGVFADLKAHVGSKPMDDDVTCLLLRVEATGPAR